MQLEELTIPGVVILTPKRFSDNRGFFSEVWNRRTLRDLGIDVDFVQDNHSLSREVGVLRGLHAQKPPFAQDKLVRVGAGRVLDVAVDARKGSPTYGKWAAVELSAENGKQLFLPKGILHGFVTREPDSELLYKCSNYYDQSSEVTVRFDDPDIGVDWGIEADRAILSDKDGMGVAFSGFDSPFSYEV